MSDNQVKASAKEVLARWIFPPLLTKDVVETKKAIVYQAEVLEEGFQNISKEIGKLRGDLLNAIMEVREAIRRLPEEEIKTKLRYKAMLLAITEHPEKIARTIYSWESSLGETLSDPLRGINTGLIAFIARLIDPHLTEPEANAILSGETLPNPWEPPMPPDTIIYLALYRALTIPLTGKPLELEEIYTALNKLDNETKKHIITLKGMLELTDKLKTLGLITIDEYYYIRARIKKWRYKPITTLAATIAQLKRKPPLSPEELLEQLLNELENIKTSTKDEQLQAKLGEIIQRYKTRLQALQQKR